MFASAACARPLRFRRHGSATAASLALAVAALAVPGTAALAQQQTANGVGSQPPAVHSLQPPLVAPGIVYTVEGSGFASGLVANVTFGGLPCDVVDVASDAQLTCAFNPVGSVQAAAGFPSLPVVVTMLDGAGSNGSFSAAAQVAVTPSRIEWGRELTLSLVGGTWSPAPANVSFVDAAGQEATTDCAQSSSSQATFSCVVPSVLRASVLAANVRLSLGWPDGSRTLFRPGLLNVTFGIPRLVIVDPDAVLDAAGGTNVSVLLPAAPPAECGGITSIVIGPWSAPSWTVVTGVAGQPHRVDIVAPPARSTEAFAMQISVGVCRLFSATSDGQPVAPASPPVSSAAFSWANYVSYPFVSSGDHFADYPVQPIGGSSAGNVTLFFRPDDLAAVAAWLTGAWVSGVECGGVVVAASALVCTGWQYSEAAGDVSGTGAAAVALPVRLRWRGGSVFDLSQGVLAVNVPLVKRAAPASALPGARVAVVGNFLVGGTATTATLGGLPCVILRSTTFSLLLQLPAVVPATTPGYPHVALAVATDAGAAFQPATIDILAQLQVVPQGPLPRFSVASDAGALSPAPLVVAAQLVDVGTQAPAAAFASATTCTLAVGSDAAEGTAAFVAADGALYSTTAAVSVGGAAAEIAFPPLGVRVAPSPTQPQVVALQVACSNAAGVAVAPLRWNLTLAAVAVQACGLPARLALSPQAPLPPFSIAVGRDCNDTSPSPPPPPLWLPHLPRVVCELAPAARSRAAVTGGAAFAAPGVGLVRFNATSAASLPGNNGTLQLRCAIGTLPLSFVGAPPGSGISVQVELEVAGCDLGSAAVGSGCAKCAVGSYGLGGDASSPCRSCPPQGVLCGGGVLVMLPGWYRSPSQAGAAFDGSTELHPCPIPDACKVQGPPSPSSYTCTVGFAGALCGACDQAAGFVWAGSTCTACPPRARSAALATVLGVATAGTILLLALRESRSPRAWSSIALRTLLFHLQVLSSLRTFTGGAGAVTLGSVFGWTSALSTSPLSWSTLQCLWQPSYLAELAFVITLPALLSASVVAASCAVAACYALRIASRDSYWRRFSSRVAQWWGQLRQVGTLVLAACFCYMSVTTAALDALRCTGPIDGSQYLWADLSVLCWTGQHAVARWLAVVGLLAVTTAFPVVAVVVLARAEMDQLGDPAFHTAWGFLYDGFRVAPVAPTPASAAGAAELLKGPRGRACRAAVRVAARLWGGDRHRCHRRLLRCVRGCQRAHPASVGVAWWQVVVLARLAVMAAIAALISTPTAQAMAASLALTAACIVHYIAAPYSNASFNWLEGCSLLVLTATAVLSPPLQRPLATRVVAQDAGGQAHGVDGQTAVSATVVVLNALALLAAVCLFVGHWWEETKEWWRSAAFPRRLRQACAELIAGLQEAWSALVLPPSARWRQDGRGMGPLLAFCRRLACTRGCATRACACLAGVLGAVAAAVFALVEAALDMDGGTEVVAAFASGVGSDSGLGPGEVVALAAGTAVATDGSTADKPKVPLQAAVSAQPAEANSAGGTGLVAVAAAHRGAVGTGFSALPLASASASHRRWSGSDGSGDDAAVESESEGGLYLGTPMQSAAPPPPWPHRDRNGAGE